MNLDEPDPDRKQLSEVDPRQGPSKSQVKRDWRALQVLAERMVSLPRVELDGLGLDEATRTAIEETARIKDPRALRRHYKRIANCLARENPIPEQREPLQALLAARDRRAREASARQHGLERWRTRLIDEGDGALTDFLDAHPDADRQRLRTLVRAARRDRERGRPDAARKLFRLLRAIVDGQAGQS